VIRVFRRHLYHDTPAKPYCARGARQFFARHGLDWPAFLRTGIAGEMLVETRDAMALRAVRHAEDEARGR
jgi:hypothetical protein